MHDGWIYQGRQEHGWFGHGTGPQADKITALPSLEDRIHSLGYTLIAGLRRSNRHHAAARLDANDHGRLDRVMEAVARARTLAPHQVARRVLGISPDAPGIGAVIEAGRLVATARDQADLRNATDQLAAGAEAMGLDQFRPFLRPADEHLTRSGGMLALLRELPASPSVGAPAAPTLSAPTPGPRLPLPPPGQLIPIVRTALGGLGIVVLNELLKAYVNKEEEAQLRAVFERFGLDPAKSADVAAAIAFRWAQFHGAWQIGGLQSGPEQQKMAEAVMRTVRADPALLPGLLSADPKTLDTVRASAGSIDDIVTRNEEERELVAKLKKEGKTRAEIEDALDTFRKSRGERGRLDLPQNPDDLLKREWVEVTHPEQARIGRKAFIHPQSGEKIYFDKGKPEGKRHQAYDHYHRENPLTSNKRDRYLDGNGNPVPYGSQDSHIEPNKKG